MEIPLSEQHWNLASSSFCPSLPPYPSLHDAHPGSDRFRCGGRESKFLAVILEAMVRGLTKKEIADELDLSVHTADFHLRHIYEKLHVNTRTAAVAKAVRERLT